MANDGLAGQSFSEPLAESTATYTSWKSYDMSSETHLYRNLQGLACRAQLSESSVANPNQQLDVLLRKATKTSSPAVFCATNTTQHGISKMQTPNKMNKQALPSGKLIPYDAVFIY